MPDQGRVHSHAFEEPCVPDCPLWPCDQHPSGRGASGWDREWAHVQERAGAPRPTRLGCSTISHDRLGFCWGCVPGEDGPVYELMAWRLLALRDDVTAPARTLSSDGGPADA